MTELALATLCLLALAYIVNSLTPWPMGFAAAPAGGAPMPPDLPERKPWEDMLMFKKGSKDRAPAPDPRIGEAATASAQLGQDWLTFAREQFAVGNERQGRIDDLIEEVTRQQLDISDENVANARKDRRRYEKLFQPVEDRVVKDAMGYDTPERQEAAAAEARADVLRSAELQTAANRRQMASMGVNPNSGRFAGMERATSLDTALAAAGAENTARQRTRDMGTMLRKDAAAMGRNLPAQSAASYGLGATTGNAAVGNNIAGQSSWAANNAIMGQGYSGAMQGYANQGNILGNLYANELGAWKAQQSNSAANAQGLMSGIGNIAGAAISTWSSEELKEDKVPVEGALDAVKAMPVEAWTYKPGVADEGRHIGPYAEDFQAATGKGDGTKIPLQDAIGITMKAVQELDEKVDTLIAGNTRKGRGAAAFAANGIA